MKNIIYLIVIFSLFSCREERPGEPSRTGQTVFLYMPWSTNLTSHFVQNIEDFEEALQDNILGNNRIIVFFSSSATEATLFELKYDKNKNSQKILKEYSDLFLTTEAGLTSILNDVVSFAPAKNYAMIIGCHGMGWLPVPLTKTKFYMESDKEKYHWENEGVPETRFFGGTTPETQTDITTLADAICNAGIKMDYILFDDCYMSTIEVAYELRHVTDYLIASPTEVMAYGFPYHKVGKYLIGNFDPQKIVDEFYDFYSNYRYPHGTISVTACAELESLAAIMKEINQLFTFNPELLDDIQRMDGYSPVIFFDFEDYVRKLCLDETLLSRFEYQLERTIPPNLRLHTESFYSMSRGPVAIDTFSGITISDPSENVKAIAKTETSWYKATH